MMTMQVNTYWWWRPGAALVCIYLIKDITEFRKSPVATCDGALFFNPKYK